MTFRNEKELIREVQHRAQVAFDQYVDVVQKRLRDETETSVYSYRPKIYQRTYQFLNSVSAYKRYEPSAGVFRATIFFDPDKMSVGQGTFLRHSKITNRVETWTYGIHADSQGKDVRRDIAKLLEKGHKASRPKARNIAGKVVGRHSYPSRSGGYMIARTDEWSHNEGVFELRRLLDKELSR